MDWIKDVSENIKKKMSLVARRNSNKIPYRTVDGIYQDMGAQDIYWWTNGFWGGLMWQLYHADSQELYREIAQNTEQKLEANLLHYDGMDHDSGFKWMLTAVANYRVTGNPTSRERALIAANSLAGRFNLSGGFLRAWNDMGERNTSGWAIIDCMMNLPLLYWASEETKDPRFRQIAQAHADTAARTFVRKDGSVNHVVVFDPETGAVLETPAGQGSHSGSAWTRGQAWALYGFTLSYRHTGKKLYLDTARKVASYFLSQIPENGLLPVDFDQPSTCDWQDDTAAAIAACGFLELKKYVEKDVAERYHAAAEKLLRALMEKSCCWDLDRDYFLEHCSAAYHAPDHNYPMMYADYFFVEAIWKLTGEELFLW